MRLTTTQGEMKMKKLIIIPTVFLGIIGGYALAQSEIFTSAEKATTITAAQAKEAALKAFGGKIVEFDYDHDDVIPHYDFEIVGTTEKVDLEVDAATGAVTITERKAFNNTAQPSVKQAIEKVENKVDEAQAKAAALKAFNGNIVEFEYDHDDVIPHYDFEIVGTTEKVDLEVNAATGAVTITKRTAIKNTAQTAVQQTTGQAQKQAANPQKTEQQAVAAKPQTSEQQAASQQTNGLITKAQAIAIAQQKASGTVTKVKFDREDNEYEIEIVNGQTEYEFDIDATTGTIISYEEDIYD